MPNDQGKRLSKCPFCGGPMNDQGKGEREGLMSRVARESPSFAMLWCFLHPRAPEPLRPTLTEDERCAAIDEALTALGGSE